MNTHIDALLELCKRQPFDIEKIEKYIRGNKLSSEEVTRAAIKLCDYGMISRGEFTYENEREPLPEELPTYNWEFLFNILIQNGLDPDLVICDDGINYKNILQELFYIDNDDLGAKIIRNILSKGGSPNIMIDGISFFVDTDLNFIMDIQMDLYYYKWQVDQVFRFWLVLIGFGGVLKDGRLPITMQGNYKPEIFKDFEKFDYNIIRKENDFELQIIEKDTKTIVATV